MIFMSRVSFRPLQGKRIVEIDFDGCTPGTFAPIILEAQQLITKEPRSSVLALTCVENVRFDPTTVAEMQRFASTCMPFLSAQAIVGISGLKKVVFQGIRPLYSVPVQLFDTRDAARAWLLSPR